MAAQTLEEVIAEVLELLDRPDLLSLARKRVRNVLKSCHASADFHRDLVAFAPVAVASGDTTSELTLPENFRKLYQVVGYGSDGEQLLTPYELRRAVPARTYFGFVGATANYFLSGGLLALTHIAPVPTTVGFYYFKYPTYVVSTATETVGQVSSDSWVLSFYPEAIVKGLLTELAKAVEHKVYTSTAPADYSQALYTMLTSELVELP